MERVAREAVALGSLLRELQRDYGHLGGEQLLDLAASLIDEAFHSPEPIRNVAVVTRSLYEAPVMRKPRTVQ